MQTEAGTLYGAKKIELTPNKILLNLSHPFSPHFSTSSFGSVRRPPTSWRAELAFGNETDGCSFRVSWSWRFFDAPRVNNEVASVLGLAEAPK